MASPHPAYRLNIKRGKKLSETHDVAAFLQYNDKLSPLLPTIRRNLKLKKDCSAVLASLFEHCEVLNLVDDQLVLSTPNAALASKLKQQLPKLQTHLQQRGWQINAIKIKVQVKKTVEKIAPGKQAKFSTAALSAFQQLDENLDNSPQNTSLKSALAKLLKKRS